MTATVREPLLLTADDLADFPDDGKRREIIDGVLLVTPPPTSDHQVIAFRLAVQLDNHVQPTGIARVFMAPIEVRFSPRDAVQPDIAVVLSSRRDIVRTSGIHGAPDLVVEVLSPSNRKYDLTEKRRLYERFGVPEYWICDLKHRTIHLFVLIDGRFVDVPPAGGRYHSTIIPGFVVDPDRLYANLDHW